MAKDALSMHYGPACNVAVARSRNLSRPKSGTSNSTQPCLAECEAQQLLTISTTMHRVILHTVYCKVGKASYSACISCGTRCNLKTCPRATDIFDEYACATTQPPHSPI